jgi:hypothetical protein
MHSHCNTHTCNNRTVNGVFWQSMPGRDSVCSELPESCCGWSMGIVWEPRRRGTSAVGSHYHRIGEDTDDWEDYVHAVVKCRVWNNISARDNYSCEL